MGASRRLKQGPGKDIFVMGSSGLAQSLIGLDLVDEYRLMIHPIVLGIGKRLFHEGAPPRTLQLVEATTTTSGLATLTYQPTRR